MRILLTGATGFLGSRTLEFLVKQPDVISIIANGRVLKESHHVKHPKIQYKLGSLENEEFVYDLTQNVDYIIHAAALSSPWGKYSEFEKANVAPQRNLLKAAKRNNIVRFILISTPSIYFNHKDRIGIKETDPLPKRLVNDYAITKRKAEILLEKSNIPFVILRPRALTGRGDTVIMPRLIRASTEGKLKIIGNGENKVDLTSVENVALAIYLGLKTDERGINQTYSISNGKPVNLWDVVQDILSRIGHKTLKNKVPYTIASLIASSLELKSKLTNYKEPALTKYSVGTLGKSFTMDITKAKELLGYQPKVSIEDAITEYINWYLESNEKS